MFSDSKRGELIAVQLSSPGLGDLLPSSQYGSQSTPAAGAMFFPGFVRKPPLTSCRVSGKRHFFFHRINANQKQCILLRNGS